jgi:hypothetical protein
VLPSDLSRDGRGELLVTRRALPALAAALALLSTACHDIVGIEEVVYGTDAGEDTPTKDASTSGRVEAGSKARACDGANFAVCKGNDNSGFGAKCVADTCDCKAGLDCILITPMAGICCDRKSRRCGLPGDKCSTSCDCAGNCSNNQCE